MRDIDSSTGLMTISRSNDHDTAKTNRNRIIPVTGKALGILKERAGDLNHDARLFAGLDRWIVARHWKDAKQAMELDHDKEFTFHAIRQPGCSVRGTTSGWSRTGLAIRKLLPHRYILTSRRRIRSELLWP